MTSFEVTFDLLVLRSKSDRSIPAVTAPIVGLRTAEQLTGSLRALEVSLSDETFRRLDEIWPGPGSEAPEAYAW